MWRCSVQLLCWQLTEFFIFLYPETTTAAAISFYLRRNRWLLEFFSEIGWSNCVVTASALNTIKWHLNHPTRTFRILKYLQRNTVSLAFGLSKSILQAAWFMRCVLVAWRWRWGGNMSIAWGWNWLTIDISCVVASDFVSVIIGRLHVISGLCCLHVSWSVRLLGRSFLLLTLGVNGDIFYS